MAEVYDRLGRLDRREQLARRAARPAMPQLEDAPAPGEDDGFAEVLEAVGRVVLRWPGIAVMVAQEGKPGQPVIRISERDGTVDAAVVGHQAASAPQPPAAAERPAPPPAPPVAPAAPPSAPPSAPPPAPPRVGTGRMAEALGGASRAARVERAHERAPERAPEPGPEQRRPDLRLVPDLPSGRHASPEGAGEVRDAGEAQDAGGPAPAGRVPLPSETSEAVARLAQILRANPSLAATWGRESQEG